MEKSEGFSDKLDNISTCIILFLSYFYLQLMFSFGNNLVYLGKVIFENT